MLQKLSCISFLFKSPCAKLITRKFYLEFYLENFKVIILFRDNIWGYQSLYLQLMSKYNKKNLFFYCALLITHQIGWFIPMNNKKTETITKIYKKLRQNQSVRQKDMGR